MLCSKLPERSFTLRADFYQLGLHRSKLLNALLYGLRVKQFLYPILNLGADRLNKISAVAKDDVVHTYL
jgi:hypothetical protein